MGRTWFQASALVVSLVITAAGCDGGGHMDDSATSSDGPTEGLPIYFQIENGASNYRFAIDCQGQSTYYSTSTKSWIPAQAKGCKAQLLEFSHQSEKFYPSPGLNFITLQAGERAQFESAEGTTRIVEIIRQIPDQPMESVNVIVRILDAFGRNPEPQ